MNLYACPICGKHLTLNKNSLVCVNNHCFDLSKDGYVNLLPANAKNSSNPGDNKEMILSRRKILNFGYYKPIAEYINNFITDGLTVVDLGCGEGYLTRQLKSANLTIYGIDISKHAISQASKQNKTINYSVASISSIPLVKNCADVIINAFAKLDSVEFLRILNDDGILLKITPSPVHLYSLKKLLYDEAYLNDDNDKYIKGFELISSDTLSYPFSVSNEHILDLIQMTPYYYTTSKKNLDKVLSLPRLTTNVDVCVSVYKKQLKETL